MGAGLLLSLAVAAGVLAATPASARVVGDSVCARHADGIAKGLCVRDGHGGTFWLGTYRGYDGVLMYCIDYSYETKWGVAHTITTADGSLETSLGGSVGAPALSALSYLTSVHPAGQVDEDTAAAISLIIRQLMGDVRAPYGRPIPGGLTVAREVRDVDFIPQRVINRARALWRQASAHRGPWRLSATLDAGAGQKVRVGDKVRATVTARNARRQPENVTVKLGYERFSGPDQVRLGADGTATFTLTALRRAGAGRITATAAGVPSSSPTILEPRVWRTNPDPGSTRSESQRGLLGRQPTERIQAEAAATVVKRQPQLVTQISAQHVEPGKAIHDTVTVTGTAGADSSFTWWLLGPVPAEGGVCPAQGDTAWNSAPVVATGTVETTGDGDYTTPGHVVQRDEVGCLTYVETLEETPSTHPVSTPIGVPSETVLVVPHISSPCVSTRVSRQRAEVGAKLRDTIKVGCIAEEDTIVVRWKLHGPVSPRNVAGKAGCNKIGPAVWKRAPVRARGRITVTGPRVVRTPAVTVKRAGCYTYSESAAATHTTSAAATNPGIAVETALITRTPVVNVPDIPTGLGLRPAAPVAPASKGGAGRLVIGKLGINAPIRAVGITGGAMAVPRDPSRLGWLNQSARGADLAGASIIAGHVSDRRDRPGALWRLRSARAGDRVVWVDQSGRKRAFKVTSVKRYHRSKGLPRSVFRVDRPRVLRIVTCTDRVTRRGGGFHYAKNLVVPACGLGGGGGGGSLAPPRPGPLFRVRSTRTAGHPMIQVSVR